jgi:uncharacterized membrane protein
MSKAGVLGLFLLATVATVLYSVVSHHLVATQDRSQFAYLFALGSVYLIVLGLGFTSNRRKSIALSATIAVLLAWWFRSRVIWDPSWIYLLQHIGTNLALAAVFGVTLLAKRTPLVTRMAHLVHKGFPPEMESYTRQVTVAWTVFFVMLCVVSGLLFALAPLRWWSVFINFMSWPLVIIMFAAEYLVRRVRFRGFEHVGILAGARAFSHTDDNDTLNRL